MQHAVISVDILYSDEITFNTHPKLSMSVSLKTPPSFMPRPCDSATLPNKTALLESLPV